MLEKGRGGEIRDLIRTLPYDPEQAFIHFFGGPRFSCTSPLQPEGVPFSFLGHSLGLADKELVGPLARPVEALFLPLLCTGHSS